MNPFLSSEVRELNLRSVTSLPRTSSFSFHIAHYLLRRGDARVTDWASLDATRNMAMSRGGSR